LQTRQLGRGGPAVSSIGFGAMLLSIAGRPLEEQAIATLRAALDAGVTFIDTADAYCLDDTDFNHNERLIAKALGSRRDGIVVATKCACRRPRGAWTVDARPEYLIEAAHASLRALGVESLDLLQLHAPDARVPFQDSVGALSRLREQGKVKLVGLSNVRVAHIEQARKITPISSVQNRYGPAHRQPEQDGVLEYCAKHGISFIAYSPFGGSSGAPFLGSIGKLAAEAKRRRVSPQRLVLAWMLAKSPAIIPIPGARRVDSVRDSVAADRLKLGVEDVTRLEAALEGALT
jgi:aryl-alcohol dehydrogenase-like predicted oxidoreductase